VREQLSRSEKLAAIGQLISGVAAELSPRSRASPSLPIGMTEMPAPPERPGNHRGGSAQGFEIVSRLVSLVQPERTKPSASS